MYEYKVQLKYKIMNCLHCPFRHENIVHEAVQSLNKLSGVVDITRITSYCMLKDEPIFVEEMVDGFNSRCPLKGKCMELPHNG